MICHTTELLSQAIVLRPWIEPGSFYFFTFSDSSTKYSIVSNSVIDNSTGRNPTLVSQDIEFKTYFCMLFYAIGMTARIFHPLFIFIKDGRKFRFIKMLINPIYLSRISNAVLF